MKTLWAFQAFFGIVHGQDLMCGNSSQAWHLAWYESTLKDARMSTLDEGLMATLTQEERDAMKEGDAKTQSVDVVDQPDDDAKSEEVERT